MSLIVSFLALMPLVGLQEEHLTHKGNLCHLFLSRKHGGKNWVWYRLTKL